MIEVAIDRLKHFEPPEGYYLAFSGGKDSVVIYDLAVQAEAKFDAHFNLSGVDPPELVRFVKTHYPDVRRHSPPASIPKLVPRKGLPRRNARWCCEIIKEKAGVGRLVLTGVRWAESPRRQSRLMYEPCRTQKTKFFLNAIIDWTDREVWEYIKVREVPYCELYDEGFKRLGCILCPMSSPRQAVEETKRWPKIEGAWRRATHLLYEQRKSRGMPSVDRWNSADEMFEWWLSREGQPKATAQCMMFE